MDNPLVQPDPGLFLWTILTFLVLLVLLAKFAWKPLLALLDRREEMIRQSLDDADKAKQELQRLQQESKEILSKARVEAQSILAKSRSEAEKLKGELRQEAKVQADSILRDAEKQIQVETEKAIAVIKTEVVDLSLLVASKLIKRNLSKEDNQSLIEESLKQVESSSPNSL
ncbi:MAG: F0F1 ATP synthase subunit B [Acidobacteria bacterium]|nr:F0F1 ATP synthase subunit B [Acidobacteriota bacterium]